MIAITAISESAPRRELSTVLGSVGWSVHHGLNTDDVIARCRDLGADLVLVDTGFPGGAMSLLDRMKSDLELFHVSVVVVGEALDLDTVTLALARGAMDVLRKPLDAAEVVARAHSALRTRALVTELTEQKDHLEELVLFDELTGIRNRRAILSDLEQMLASARRAGHGLSVAVIDVDRFKVINDVHGHAVGDEVLREVTRRIQSRMRSADVLGRLGGDELLVLLADTDADGAGVLAGAIRDAVGECPVPTGVGDVAVTISLGTAGWTGETAAELIERADHALLAAKSAGRDRAAAAAS